MRSHIARNWAEYLPHWNEYDKRNTWTPASDTYTTTEWDIMCMLRVTRIWYASEWETRSLDIWIAKRHLGRFILLKPSANCEMPASETSLHKYFMYVYLLQYGKLFANWTNIESTINQNARFLSLFVRSFFSLVFFSIHFVALQLYVSVVSYTAFELSRHSHSTHIHTQ